MMSEVTVERIINTIQIETNNNVAEVLQEVHRIEVSKTGEQGRTGEQGPQGDKGDQGDPGQGVPAGGTSRQVLAKIDATDYNTLWRSNWYDYSTNVEYTGVETSIASGTVYTCTIDAATIYRFVNSTNNANGYPIEDSFYQNFDGSNLTNLLVTRG
jgi:hypothetical protein